MWEQLTDNQRAALRAAVAAGDGGLTGETHPAEFTEAPQLIDRGYMAEVATGRLVITSVGAALVPDEEPSTGEIEDVG